MSLLQKFLRNRPPTEPLAKTRVVPSQEAMDTYPDKVWMGQDLGPMDFSGNQPKPGDMGVVIGSGSRKTLISGQAIRQPRAPLFVNSCLCNCGNQTGLALYLTAVQQSGALLILDNTADTLLQFSGLGELGFGVGNIAFPNGGGIAVDQQAPYNLYILDDRRSLITIKTDANPIIKRGYFTIVTYTLVNGTYAPTAYVNMVDPYSGSVFPPAVEPDPPAIPTNCLSVIDGTLHITMLDAPARYLTLSGGILTTHNIIQNGVNYNKGLRGPIVTLASPAKKTDRFVIATDGTSFEILKFSSSDMFSSNLDLTGTASSALGLVSFCNRMLVMNAAIPTS